VNTEPGVGVDILAGAQAEELLDQRAPLRAFVAFALELLRLALGPEDDELGEVDALSGAQRPQPSKRPFHRGRLGHGVARGVWAQ
jgi:hypothetical protein